MRGTNKLSRLCILLGIFLIFVFSFSPVISAASIKTTTDPTRIGVGARTLGMGKAFVGLADDASAIFMNPAGIAQLTEPQGTSMTTKLIQIIDYLTIGGVYPTEYGNFGFGYVGASLGGSFVTGFDLVEDPDGRVYPVATAEVINYSNSVMVFSFGTEGRQLLDSDIMDNLLIGANLKLFTQGLSGVVGGGNATGMDMDVGMIYKANEWMNVGLNLRDILPMDMGGEITYQSGLKESIPAYMVLGTAVQVLGDKGLYDHDHELYYLLDMNYRIQGADYPQTFHTGVEYWPNESLALRFGIDQDLAGRGELTGEATVDITSNMTAGVGFLYEGFRFDYAYHQYSAIQSNDTHYFSLSYGFGEPKAEVVEERKPKTYFDISSPQDKTILYDEKIKIAGLVTELEDVRRLTINDVEVPITVEGSFEVATSLTLGKNVFDVKAYDAEGLVLKSAKIRLLRMIKFKDVPDKYWAKAPIEELAVLGMIGGYPDGTFRPDKVISRAELTTLLVRSQGIALPVTAEKLFNDLPKGHWAAKYVQVGVAEKLVTGYPDKTFKPNKSMTRAEGVTVLTRFAKLELPEILLEGPFPDVPGRHWAAKAVAAAKSAGMLNYLVGKPFELSKSLTRAEAVEMLSKTPFAAARIADLMNFDDY
ncbi:PorV/PorQ family protein [Candidatus Margulisiibacteriota bacterium]